MGAETFYGPWQIDVVGGDALAKRRFVITGSDNADGAYPGTLATAVRATGDAWVVTMEWLDHAVYKPSRIARSATYDIQRGLLVTLGADDGPPGACDQDFNDFIVLFQSQDPAIDPDPPKRNPFDFTITEDMLTQ